MPGDARRHTVLAATDATSFASLRHTAIPRAERYAIGRGLRERVPRSSLAAWDPDTRRGDPVAQVIASNEGRVPRLVPVRIGRMAASPFAFLRGAAAIMAEDFAHLPSTGILPVICGDAHLGNFGFYASPERDLVFDLNDFDEAHPGAWEWDLRRLVASVHMAGRQNGTTEQRCADAVARCVRAYRGHRPRDAARDRAGRPPGPPQDQRPRPAAVHPDQRRGPAHRRGAAADHPALRRARRAARRRPRRVPAHAVHAVAARAGRVPD